MSEADVVIAVFAALAPTLAVIVSSFLAHKWVNTQAEETQKGLAVNHDGIAKVHFLVNGRLDESLARIKHLEEALGLGPGEAIQLTTVVKDGIDIREDK